MVFLGSKSPRRKELLNSIINEFEIISKDVDESFDVNENVDQVPIILAQRKFDSIIPDLDQNDILITADTVVIKDGVIYNKADNAEEAAEMIRLLMGGFHFVTTGVVVGDRTKNIPFSTTTKVYMDDLNEDEIHFYIENFRPYDKAGSYGIQDWIGMTKISKIEGSYANVMGLPTQSLYEVIKSNFPDIIKGPKY